MMTLSQKLLRLEPQYRERVWGGRRLKAAEPPVGEAWVAFGESLVRGGEHEGQSVSHLASAHGAELLGRAVFEKYGARFPLLVKLLDCADWLSVQVHPNDEQARRLVGPEECGKTEAWYFIEAEEGATIYAGVKSGTSAETLAAAIRSGQILDVAAQLPVRSGETVYIPAGTLHALGPGLLLYEVQQSSDTTFRVYDWGRPASAGRKLHIEESVAVIDPQKVTVPTRPTLHGEGTSEARALGCPFFDLDFLRVAEGPLACDTRGDSFQVLTVTTGCAKVLCDGESASLGRFETLLVVGGAGRYEIHHDAGAEATLLRASVPA